MNSKPKRILHVLTRMDYGGAETLLMNLYRMIDKNEYQFDFAVSSQEEAPYDKEIVQMGGKIIKYPKYNGYNHVEYCKWWDNFFSQKGNDYVIIHGHIGSTAAIYLNKAKKYGLKTIAHSHGCNEPIRDMRTFLYRFYSYPTRYISDFFIGCSKEALIDRYGLKTFKKKDKSFVLKNGIIASKYVYDKELRFKMREKYDIGMDTFVIGHVGRTTKAKNLFFLLDIFEEIHKIHPNSILLRIGKGELDNQFNKEISNRNLYNCILKIESTSRVYDYLQMMDVFVFPSIFEGLPLSLIEAQASGLPVLASDIVTRETSISPLISYIPLNKSADYWANKALNYIGFNRLNTFDFILKSGFDIKKSANILIEFYNSILIGEGEKYVEFINKN